MQKMLKRYWLETNNQNRFPLGIGVTAFSEQDLKNILNEKIGEPIIIESIIMIKSIDELEQNHVVPNMEEFVSRGVWFPKGFK